MVRLNQFVEVVMGAGTVYQLKGAWRWLLACSTGQYHVPKTEERRNRGLIRKIAVSG